MTDEERMAALNALGPERAAEALAKLRPSDLADIAKARGIRPRFEDTPEDLAKRVVSVTRDQAKRGARRERQSRASR